MKKIGIGIIGCGGIAVNKHIKELLQVQGAEITALCDIDVAALRRAGELACVGEAHRYRDYRDLIADGAVDAVEICTPNCHHAEMACAALRAGKPVNLEKPIAMNMREAEEILAAERESSAFGMVSFSYRFMPAVRYAKHLVDAGAIGRVVGVNVAYLKSSAFWQGRRLEWRFEAEKAGSGVTGDLGAHLIDLAQMLAGRVSTLCAVCDTVVKERPTLDGTGVGTVTTDDTALFLARFACGAVGSFHITRCAIGHANTIRYDIYGDRGSISFDLNDPSILTITNGEGDPKHLRPRVEKVPEEFALMQEQAFSDALRGERDPLFPTISDGVQGQAVIDAILRSSVSGEWVTV